MAQGAGSRVTLLLTLPGLPFVYYGEEIGMTGDKPDDERLRTPDAVEPRAATAASRSGTPWEPLQPDSATATVAGAGGGLRARC